MKKIIVLISFLVLSGSVVGQKYKSEKGVITFFSDGVVEDIAAENNSSGSLFDAATGELVFIVPIKNFQFQKALMREHFNEKYMETEKYPKSTFQGKVSGYVVNNAGQQPVKAVGKLTLHGVTRDVNVPGTLEFSNGKALIKSQFIIRLADYKIKIPTIVWQNIAEQVELKIDFIYKTI
jgi:hypothetical protein